MFRILYLLVSVCTFLLISQSTVAQSKDSKRFAAIENEKIAYITKELNLTTSEAQKFFPIYNQYSKELWKIKSEKSGTAESGQDHSALRSNSLRGSSGQRDILSYDAKELAVKKEYRTKFSDVIGKSRAAEFFQIEQNFRDLLYKELQRRQR